MRLKNQYIITNCVERWLLQGGPWRSAAPLPLPLAFHSVVRMNDRLYVMGGRTPQVVFLQLLLCIQLNRGQNEMVKYKEHIFNGSGLVSVGK